MKNVRITCLAALLVVSTAIVSAPAAFADEFSEGDGSAETLNDITRGPWITNVTENGATIRWESLGLGPVAQIQLDDPVSGNSYVVNGTAVSQGSGEWLNTVELAKLNPGITYTFIVLNISATATEGQFRTSPDEEPFTAVLFGDYQNGSPIILNNIYEQNAALGYGGDDGADLYLTTGDMITGTSWDSFFSNADFLPYGAFASSLGNNDYSGMSEWKELFDMPGVTPTRNYYYVDYSNTRFLMLYSGVGDSSNEFPPLSASPNCDDPASQTDWVYCRIDEIGGFNDAEAELAGMPVNVIVLLHQPSVAYGGSHPANPYQVANLVPLLEDSWKVRAVFNGHNHYYQRVGSLGGVSDLQYFTIGGAGGSLYNPTTPQPPAVLAQTKAYHFISLLVDGYDISVRMIQYSGGAFSVFETVEL